MGFCTVWPQLCPRRDGGDKNIQSQKFSSSGPMFRLIKKKKLKIIYLTSNSGLCCLFRLLLAHPTHTATPQVGQSVPPTQQPAGGRSLPTQGQAAVSYYICHHPGSSCCPLHTLTPLYITVEQTQIHWELVLGLGVSGHT